MLIPQKVNRAVYLNFTNSNRASAQVTIPFKVKYIKTKSIVYKDDTVPLLVTNVKYGTVSSDLCSHEPIGVFINDYTVASNHNDDITFVSRHPLDLNATYDFYCRDGNGNSLVLDGRMIIILEFTESLEL